MSAWSRKYDDEQREAIARAWCELRVRPLAELVRRAAAGELTTSAGDRVPAFEIPQSSARSIALAAERRLSGGQLPAELARMAPRDRADSLQRRLTALADQELSRMEREHERSPRKPLDAEHARKVARLLRELGTLPDPSERRLPTTPGDRAGGERDHEPTRDSLGGQLLAAADASRAPRLQAAGERLNGGSAEHDALPRRDGEHERDQVRAELRATTSDHAGGDDARDHDDDNARDHEHGPCSGADVSGAELAAAGVSVRRAPAAA